MISMNRTRIIELRQQQGWTQERLATESGVGLRTVQRLEAGQDASLETLSLVADALQVSVRDLFIEIDDEVLRSGVESLADRTALQQAAHAPEPMERRSTSATTPSGRVDAGVSRRGSRASSSPAAADH